MRVLITGGAGFVGSNLSKYLSERFENCELISVDNLQRKGSEVNMKQLLEHGITFKYLDLKIKEEIEALEPVDYIIHCASDSSVLSGIEDSSHKLLSTNLYASINLFEVASKWKSKIIFFSTNRVYPSNLLSEIKYERIGDRFVLKKKQIIEGISYDGINEAFSTEGTKTFYGSSKLCCELLLQEYKEYKGLKFINNRFGVISGPGQLGVGGQGVISYWVKNILLSRELSYFGFGGKGYQVRDALHIDDVCRIVHMQIQGFENHVGKTFNIGGGLASSFSLNELTKVCEDIVGKKVNIKKITDNRIGDIPIYYTDNKSVEESFDWKPEKDVSQIVADLLNWYESDLSSLTYF